MNSIKTFKWIELQKMFFYGFSIVKNITFYNNQTELIS